MDYEFDEVDTAMMCLLTDEQERFAESDINSELTYSEGVAIEEAYDNIDRLNIILDESETDPIDMEISDDLDAESDLLMDDEDGELIDMLSCE